ncbi:hypothetical protein [Chryseobacterium taihuense]|uniref:TonB C-terminal domain-containing protein n=1 Tax=Chryseobacterium taihuense TaxID=1141221 RepID=A0ABY0QQK1_9FLAO|nr:hypothetical protein [Chryseobacterium taihuense]SDL51834.1 hypothetical protein SAMN05216273_10217 [Chryseobacterium taihuense]
MNKFFVLVGLFITLCLKAQILYEYPKGQLFYEGGRDAFNKEIKEVAGKIDLKPCEKTEALFMRFVVYPDNKVKYVADPDVKAVENNKCLKDKVLKAITEMKNWNVAEVNGTKTPAMFCALFYDDLLFNKEMSENDFSKPVYIHKEKESDIMKFRENFAKCFDNRGYTPNGTYSFIINFDIDTNGEAGFFYIENQSNLEKFNEMVVDCASNTKKSYWKPAYYKGVPIKQVFKMPIKFNED